MQSKNNTLDLHKTVAHEIKAAKKRMFKRHREGMPLPEAASAFCVDMAARFRAVVPDYGHDSAVTSERNAEAPAHTQDILDGEHLNYAIAQTIELSRCGVNSGMAALIRHFRDLAVTGRGEEAKEDAEKWLGALAKERFDRESRAQFLEDFKLDTGEDDTAVN